MNKIVTIEKIEDGMILSDPILNQFSQILLPAGTILSAFHIDILKRWNVNYVHINIEDDEDIVDIPMEILLQVKNEISSKLLWTPELEIEVDLFNSAVKYKSLNMIKKSGNYEAN